MTKRTNELRQMRTDELLALKREFKLNLIKSKYQNKYREGKLVGLNINEIRKRIAIINTILMERKDGSV